MPQLGLKKLNRCPWSVLDYLQYPAACPAPCKNIQCNIQFKIRKDLLITYNQFSWFILSLFLPSIYSERVRSELTVGIYLKILLI